MDKIAKIQYSYLHGAVDLFNAGTNDYYGSLSPKDGSTGAFANHFNYKVVLHAEDKKPIKIIAAWYWGCYNFENTDESLITTKEFEPSEKGAADAVSWLQSEYDRT